jgi:hypothetical protein
MSNKALVIFAILAVIIVSVPSDAPYIKAKGRPLNIKVYRQPDLV